MDTIKNYKLSFAALDPYLESNIVKPDETSTTKGWVTWGKRNDYPSYIYGLYENVSTLKSIIDGLTTYICGNSAEILGRDKVNSKGQTFEEVLHMIAKDYCLYGGFALNILRNRLGGVAEIHYVDFKNLRSNEEHTEFYYAKDWSKSFGRVKYTIYPAYSKESKDPSSVFYFSNEYNKTYPTPIYGASLLACEIEKKVTEFHLNTLNNGFVGNYIINMNNGLPEEQIKNEIEEAFFERFCGTENAGRPVIAFNDSKDNEVTIQRIAGDDFGERYTELVKRSRQEIFTAFRCNPNLFGISTDNIGFSKEEYEQAYKLFYTTVVKPIQNIIVNQIEKIYGLDMVKIEPFRIEWDE